MKRRRGATHQGPRLPEYFASSSTKTLKKVNTAPAPALTALQVDCALRGQKVLPDSARERLRCLLAPASGTTEDDDLLDAVNFALRRLIFAAPNEEWVRKYRPRFAEEGDPGLRAMMDEFMLRISEFFFGGTKKPIALSESIELVEAFGRSYHFEIFKINMLEQRRLQDVLTMLKKSPMNMDIKINLRHCSQPPVVVQINAPIKGDIHIHCSAVAPRRRSQQRIESPATLKKLYLISHLDSFCDAGSETPGLAEQLRALLSLSRKSKFPFVFVLPPRPSSPLLRAAEDSFVRVAARKETPGALTTKLSAVAFVEGNMDGLRAGPSAAVAKCRWPMLFSRASALVLEGKALRVPAPERVRAFCARFGNCEEKVLANAPLFLRSLFGESSPLREEPTLESSTLSLADADAQLEAACWESCNRMFSAQTKSGEHLNAWRAAPRKIKRHIATHLRKPKQL